MFRDPERTRLAVDGEGWLHTGDIGEWQLNGTLKIIDRCAFCRNRNTEQALVKSSQLSPAANVSGIRFVNVAHISNQHPLGHLVIHIQASSYFLNCQTDLNIDGSQFLIFDIYLPDLNP